MKNSQTAMKKTLLALSAVALSLTAPAYAGPNQLQWRSTPCTFQSGRFTYESSVLCKAGFGYDTVLRAIKYWDAVTNRWVYNEIGQQGVNFGNSSNCLNINYDDGGQDSYCTVRSSRQLGIIGD
jgi:hypothetical protein